jgi:hypothetical protein
MWRDCNPALRARTGGPAAFRQQVLIIRVEERLALSREDAMVRHADHHDGIDALLRANRVLVLSLLWAALAACVVSSLAYDVVQWVHAW